MGEGQFPLLTKIRYNIPMMQWMMHRYIWIGVLWGIGLAVLLQPVRVAASDPAPVRTDAFESASCMFDNPTSFVEGETIECGYVRVPEQHANPDGPSIRLAVAILKSQADTPAPDPVFIAQGGPGGSGIDTYTQVLDAHTDLLAKRDIVLFDQRGTLYSEPSLMCQEVLDLTIETIEQDLSTEEETQQYIEATLACKKRLEEEESINLSAYNSIENAADIDALRVALGYEEINLYGVSYGSLLALHTMRNYGHGLRSVILDGVVPTQLNFVAEVPHTFNESMEAFFDACANDAACNKAYPDLENMFYDLIRELNEHPTRIALTNMDTKNTYQAVLDGDTLEDAMFQMLYATDILPAIPMILYDVRDGTYDALGRMLSILVFDNTISEGMYYSVLCAEDADFTLDDVNITDVPASIAESQLYDIEGLLDVCGQWDVERFGPVIDAPVESDIPTLLFSGVFDPVTPSHFADAAAESLTQSYVYTFPYVGHGAAFTGPCANDILEAFLDDPTVEPDSTCLANTSGLDFMTPATVLKIPKLLGLFNLEGNAVTTLLLFGVSLALLLSAILVWPVVWLLRLLRASSASAETTSTSVPLLARVARWSTLLNAVLLLAFFVGVFVVGVMMALDNDMTILFGIPTQWAGLFVCPIVSVLFTFVMLAGSIQSWRQGFWPLWERGYFALLTLAALICVGVLTSWGMVGTVFF